MSLGNAFAPVGIGWYGVSILNSTGPEGQRLRGGGGRRSFCGIWGSLETLATTVTTVEIIA